VFSLPLMFICADNLIPAFITFDQRHNNFPAGIGFR
jgi:hypothetical protein